ncbi:WG repeat-containing protein [Fodinicurvata fenggangensis]|uniref:WG repeat-containing protein n=1 Tax=Fodinicurvata fenggangensis TaxID=1121830 RepID=UPI0004793180|nr:WG repeat-containing protein [Fodinicurvata fenggangensis]
MRKKQLACCLPLLVFTTPAIAGTEEPETWHPTQDYYLEKVVACEAGEFTTSESAGAVVRYEVVGQEEQLCRLRFTYLHNPNPQLAEKPLTFLVDPSASDLESEVKNQLRACLEGGGPEGSCQGELYQVLGGSSAEAAQQASTEGPLPCGQPVEAEGAPLYPMPKGGKWGYVDRDGNWVIEPQWEQVDDFSEGRAAVGTWQRWGIIDRSGSLVLDIEYENPSYTTHDDRRISSAPFELFSEGCAAAEIFTSEAEYLFVDRDGGLHRPSLPNGEELAGLGNFSEGLAWFSWSEDLEWHYGWLDSQGEVAIPAEFADAGDFVNGMAPAESQRGGAGFIDPTGQLVLPRKWTLESARAFSEGLAPVSVEAFTTLYMNQEDFAIEQVHDPETGKKVEIEMGGAFQSGRAPVKVKLVEDKRSVLAYIDNQGQVAFVPERLPDLAPCHNARLPEFHGGLLRLLVADDGKSCGEGAFGLGLPSYPDAHYVYLDPEGQVVLRQEKTAGDQG